MNGFLSTVDQTMEIEDPSDRKLFDSIFARPREQVCESHIAFLKSLIARGGKKFVPKEVKP